MGIIVTKQHGQGAFGNKESFSVDYFVGHNPLESLYIEQQCVGWSCIDLIPAQRLEIMRIIVKTMNVIVQEQPIKVFSIDGEYFPVDPDAQLVLQ